MCTNFALLDADPNSAFAISARTMDFNVQLDAKAVVVPRGQRFPATAPTQFPLSWQARYGYTAMNCTLGPASASADGINEKGLSAGALWLADVGYPDASTATEQCPALYCVDVCDWILGNFADLDTLEQALGRMTVIAATGIDPSLDIRLHWIATDSSGNSLIIEYVDGKLLKSHSKNGVMTNTPPYPWHLNNLVNFLPLSLDNSTNTLPGWGEEVNGSGLLGMPGDYVSPNRFIRAWYLRQSSHAYPPKSLDEAVGLAARILQNCAMPIGSARMQTQPAGSEFEYTQFGVIRDHRAPGYYFFTQFNNNLFYIDLARVDFTVAGAPLPTLQGDWRIDLTDQLSASS
jgi:penicillin V acylase-like amidase (Ntn superfamily)